MAFEKLETAVLEIGGSDFTKKVMSNGEHSFTYLFRDKTYGGKFTPTTEHPLLEWEIIMSENIHTLLKQQ